MYQVIANRRSSLPNHLIAQSSRPRFLKEHQMSPLSNTVRQDERKTRGGQSCEDQNLCPSSYSSQSFDVMSDDESRRPHNQFSVVRRPVLNIEQEPCPPAERITSTNCSRWTPKSVSPYSLKDQKVRGSYTRNRTVSQFPHIGCITTDGYFRLKQKSEYVKVAIVIKHRFARTSFTDTSRFFFSFQVFFSLVMIAIDFRCVIT